MFAIVRRPRYSAHVTPHDRTTRLAKRDPAETFAFVDLFAGIGGFRLGVEAAGGECVYSVELDRFARKTYAANFDDPQGWDIRDVLSLPPHDLLVAGFPCQPFSIAGVSKKASLGRHHGFLDQTQGTLFFDLARLIESSRPPMLLLENVKNLVSHDKGRTFRVIRETLRGLNYNISYAVIDARHWVPQHRERLFIVGLNQKVFGSGAFHFPSPSTHSDRRLGALLESDVPQKYILSQHLWEYLQGYAKKHRRLGNGFGYGLVTENDTTRTLSARYFKDGSEILISRGDGQRPRRLTPRECARLMGFPENFRIVVSDTQAYKQFGNAVVVPVVEWLAREVLSQTRALIDARSDEPVAAVV